MMILAGAFNAGCAVFIGLCAIGQIHNGAMGWAMLDAALCALNVFAAVGILFPSLADQIKGGE